MTATLAARRALFDGLPTVPTPQKHGDGERRGHHEELLLMEGQPILEGWSGGVRVVGPPIVEAGDVQRFVRRDKIVSPGKHDYLCCSFRVCYMQHIGQFAHEVEVSVKPEDIRAPRHCQLVPPLLIHNVPRKAVNDGRKVL